MSGDSKSAARHSPVCIGSAFDHESRPVLPEALELLRQRDNIWRFVQVGVEQLNTRQ